MRAPVPAAFPADETSARSHSGISPSTIAYLTSMCAPKAPASRIRSTFSTPKCSISNTAPACKAAFASWIARTSFWVTRMSCSPSCRTKAKVRSSATTRADVIDSCSLIFPSADRTPARNISATTSMMPEPQIPVTPLFRVCCSKSGSSDQRSQPITLNLGSSVPLSIRTRSIAPGAARCPELICAPSKAGPVGLDAASIRCLLPSSSSALVPTSTIRDTSSRSYGASASSTPAASAPTCPAIHGSA